MKWQNLLFLFLVFPLLMGCGATDSKAAPLAPNVLEVTRSSHTMHLPPFSRTISDASAVQRLYDAAQKLPKGRFHTWMCAVGSTVIYHVHFLRGKTVLQQWDMDAIGCYAIALHKDDLRQPDQAFLALFASTLGLAKLY